MSEQQAKNTTEIVDKVTSLMGNESWKTDLVKCVKANAPNAAVIAAPTKMGKTQQEALRRQVESLEKRKGLNAKNAAFRDWQNRLNRGEKLPRGKFFDGKKAGKSVIIIDEAHRYF